MGLTELSVALGDKAIAGEPLSRHTTFGIGGPADLFVVAHALPELCHYVRLAWEHGVPYFILGNGANLLVSDKGIRGLVIHNQCRAVQIMPGEEEQTALVIAESGAELRTVARQAIAQGLAGLEWAVDVPGTVGGAVVGNAGAYGGYVSDSLRGVAVFS
ncbi:MAG: FAD-binding protein, partial [Anaerolineae bacterium]